MKLRLGIFVTAGLVILVGIIFYIGRDKNMFNSTFKANAVFKDIGGLEIGNHIRFSGINVGVVDGIQILTDTSVLVQMLVDQSVKPYIKTDAIVTIGSDGLMGDKNLAISQGTINGESVDDGHIFRTREPVDMDAMIGSLKNTGENAEIITSELAEILFKINNGDGTLARLISDSSFADDLSATMYNLKEGSEKLDENMEAAQKSFLLRGFFKKKKKEQEKLKEEAEKNAEDSLKKN